MPQVGPPGWSRDSPNGNASIIPLYSPRSLSFPSAPQTNYVPFRRKPSSIPFFLLAQRVRSGTLFFSRYPPLYRENFRTFFASSPPEKGTLPLCSDSKAYLFSLFTAPMCLKLHPLSSRHAPDKHDIEPLFFFPLLFPPIPPMSLTPHER